MSDKTPASALCRLLLRLGCAIVERALHFPTPDVKPAAGPTVQTSSVRLAIARKRPAHVSMPTTKQPCYPAADPAPDGLLTETFEPCPKIAGCACITLTSLKCPIIVFTMLTRKHSGNRATPNRKTSDKSRITVRLILGRRGPGRYSSLFRIRRPTPQIPWQLRLRNDVVEPQIQNREP